jgi:hypothetical protein
MFFLLQGHIVLSQKSEENEPKNQKNPNGGPENPIGGCH